MTEALLAHHYFPHAALDAGSTPHGGDTLLTGGSACYGVYETADSRFLAVGALEVKFWRAFCEAAGLAELTTRHWSQGEAPGSAAAHETIELVAARLRSRTLAQWNDVFAAVDACVTPVLTPAEALASEQAAARCVVHHAGAVTAVGPLARLSDHQLELKPAPRAGEHTRPLLAELGLSADRIDALIRDGIVRCAT
jgi:crotonobetainyl-CoA:carnitine CoA-transferase CaiB-like acyl-CoA transferase